VSKPRKLRCELNLGNTVKRQPAIFTFSGKILGELARKTCDDAAWKTHFKKMIKNDIFLGFGYKLIV